MKVNPKNVATSGYLHSVVISLYVHMEPVYYNLIGAVYFVNNYCVTGIPFRHNSGRFWVVIYFFSSFCNRLAYCLCSVLRL